MHLTPGRKVDRYVIGDPIGEGAMAVVYAARHEKLGTEHAIKVLTRATPDVTRRLLAEGRAQARLRHPAIVNVTDVIEIDGQPGLVMEHIRGPTLAELIAGPQLSVERIDALVRPLLEGVDFAHAKGLIHRDLKPGNILIALTPSGPEPKIVDFGLAKFLGGSSGSMFTETMGGMALGTPYYMAPEQFDPSIDISGATDVWSLGVLLYELITGQRPFQGIDVLEVTQHIRAGTYTPLAELRDHVPQRWQRAVRGALQVDVSQRWRSPGELLAAFMGDITRRATIPPGSDAIEDPWTAELRVRYLSQTEPSPQPLDAAAETIDPGSDWHHRAVDTSEVPKQLPQTSLRPLQPDSAGSRLPQQLALVAAIVLVIAGALWMRPAPTPLVRASDAEVRPPPASSEVPAATVSVDGVDPSFVRLKDERGLFAVGAVPAGVYEVLLRDEHGVEETALEGFTLVSGEAYTLVCKPKRWRCERR